MSSDNDDNVPPASVCTERINDFVAVTKTDEAFAQMVLQENEWDLQKALDVFFNQSPGATTPVNFPKDCVVSTKPPDTLTLVSWNIDGLSQKNLEARARHVCDLIEESKVSVVFLQEVVKPTWKIIKDKLFNYFCISEEGYDYFTAILLRKMVVYLDDFQTISYPTSRMGRNMLLVNCHVGKAKMTLINTHLESTKEHADERGRQLSQCWKAVLDQGEDKTVIFGGDLNLRDSELSGANIIPAGIEDIWIRTGSRKECQYTWDMVRNSNLEFPGKFKPRCRFDRLYIRESSPLTMKPETFGLEGIEKLARHQCFPSDHWAIKVLFRVKSD